MMSPIQWAPLFRRAALFLGFALLGAIPGAATAAAAPSLDLTQHRGRVVIVDFWASWCKPCRQSIPWLNAMRERYGAQGLTIIGVNVDAERRDADRFLNAVPIAFDVVFDPAGDLATQFRVKGMPSSYVFDRNGKLVDTYIGFREATRAEHEAALEKLLNPRPQ
jgi:cytochrome c biogenesis protein CcmG/thiol:disulfide interchange protein DsbE